MHLSRIPLRANQNTESPFLGTCRLSLVETRCSLLEDLRLLIRGPLESWEDYKIEVCLVLLSLLIFE
jgi:hypothetical protein